MCATAGGGVGSSVDDRVANGGRALVHRVDNDGGAPGRARALLRRGGVAQPRVGQGERSRPRWVCQPLNGDHVGLEGERQEETQEGPCQGAAVRGVGASRAVREEGEGGRAG